MGKPVRFPTSLHVSEEGVRIGFTCRVDPKDAALTDNYAVEQWNYRWTKAYGSPEYSVKKPDRKGHDTMNVRSATVSADGRSVLLKIDELGECMQMKIKFRIRAADGAPISKEIYHTINFVAASGDRQ